MRTIKAFTLIEIIASIAIVAILVAVMVPVVGNFVRQSRETSDRQTLAVLNDAINRYKMQGGDIAQLTSDLTKAELITLLSTPVNWNGFTHQFLRGSGEIDTNSTLAVTGSGKDFRISAYGSYEGEAGGTELFASFDKTGLLAWYDFDDATDSHGSNDLTLIGAPTFSGGILTTYQGANAPRVNLYDDGWADINTDYSYTIRFRVKPTTPNGAYVMFRGYRERIKFVNSSLVEIQIANASSGDINPASTDHWYTATAVFDRTNGFIYYYVDGVEVRSLAIGSPSGSSGDLGIGFGTGDSGDMDFAYAGFFTRALTPSEVSQLHDVGADTQYSDL